MKLTLQEIHDENRAVCEASRVTGEQADLIAPDLRSLEQAAENSRLVPSGVWADDGRVGILPYHQRQGIGSRTMELVMDTIRAAGAKTDYFSFRPENTAAKQLYKKPGFQFHEEEPDGELVYRYGPVRDIPLT